MLRTPSGARIRALAVLIFACAATQACSKPTPPPPKEEEAAEGHPSEVHLKPEAIERSGIKLGVVERRAMTGGHAVPAEIDFDPASTAHVGPLVSGRLTSVRVALGDRVKKGQLLATVASGELSSTQAKLEQTNAEIVAAEANLRRMEDLNAQGITAKRDLIDAQSRVTQLRAEANGLARMLTVLGSSNGKDLELVAPLDGVIVALHATLGETASPEEPAFVITDPSKVWVQGSIPELEITRANLGDAVVVRVHALPELALPGSLTYMAPALDEHTRSLPIRVTLDRVDPRLRSGLFGTIEIIGGSKDDRPLAVPSQAIAMIDGQPVVFVPGDEDGSFKPAPIVLGRRSAGWFELVSGLEEGAKIAVTGAFTLRSALQKSEFAEEE